MPKRSTENQGLEAAEVVHRSGGLKLRRAIFKIGNRGEF